jgi:nucleoside permease NupC
MGKFILPILGLVLIIIVAWAFASERRNAKIDSDAVETE